MNWLRQFIYNIFAKHPQINTWYFLAKLKPSAKHLNYTQAVEFITTDGKHLQGTFFEVYNSTEQKHDIIFIAYNGKEGNFNPTQHKSNQIEKWMYIELDQ